MNEEINDLRRSITCSICLDTFQNPVSLTSCRHSFCRACLNAAMEIKQTCPVCVVKYNEQDIVDSSYAIQLIENIQQLVVQEEKNYLRQVVTTTSATNRASSSLPLSNTSSTVTTSPLIPTYQVDQLVEVESRMWPGINKPGGSARITAMGEGEYEGTYDVKYVISCSHEKHVHYNFIKPSRSMERCNRRRSSDFSNAKALDVNRRHSSISSSSLRSPSTVLPLAPMRKTTCNSECNIRLCPKSNSSSHSQVTELAYTTNSSNVSSNALNNIAVTSAKHTIVLLTSGLSEEESKHVISFVEAFPHATQAITFDTFSPTSSTITHLIVPVNEDRVCPHRTMKYLQAIMCGIWIVSSEWLRRSVETGHVHKEVNYEVISCVKATKPKAPARARCARNRLDKNGWTVENKGPFAGLVVCLYGDYPLPQPPRSQLQFLLNYGGAVCCKLEEFMEIFNSAVVSTVKIASNRKSHFVITCMKECQEECLKTLFQLLPRNVTATITSIEQPPATSATTSMSSIRSATSSSHLDFTKTKRGRGSVTPVGIEIDSIVPGTFVPGANESSTKGGLDMVLTEPIWILACATDYDIVDVSSGRRVHVQSADSPNIS